MSPFYRYILLPAAVATAVAQPEREPAHQPVSLAHFTVSAHPYAQGDAVLAQPTHVLLGDELARHQASSLGQLLASQTGISSSWFGPGASRPIIRGMGGDRVRVLQNSIGTFDASITSPDHSVALDPLLIERVEVVRGPASLLYGASAVGGAVNVVTHRIHSHAPETVLEGRAEVRVGSASDERSGGVLLEGTAGPVAWHIDGFRRLTDDVRIPGTAERLHDDEDEEHEHDEPAGTIPNTAIRSDGGAVGLSIPGANGHLGVAYSGYNSLYGVPSGGHHHADDEEHEEDEHDAHGAPVRIDLRQRRVDLEGEYRPAGGWVRAARMKVARADYRHLELEGDEIGTLFEQRGLEGRAELLHEPVGPFEGAIGIQAEREHRSVEGEEAFLPPSRNTRGALFVFEEASRERITWQFGGRLERHRTVLSDHSGRSRSDTGWAGSAGMVWSLRDPWALAVSLSRTERPPNAQELFADGAHVGTQTYEVGDPALDSESSTGLDVSLRRRHGRVTGELTVFVNQFNGFIHETPTGEIRDDLPVYHYVQRDARFVGAELETVLHLHENGTDRLDLTLAADVVRGSDRDEHRDLPRISPARLRVGADWARGALSLGTEVQRVQSQSHVAPDESPTDGYTLLLAYAGWRIIRPEATIDLLVRGENLLDEEARVHTSFLKDIAPLPGRGVTVSVRTSF